MAAASLIALLAATPTTAQAAEIGTKAKIDTSADVKNNNPDTPEVDTVTEQDVKKGWENTKDAVKETYEDMKAALLDDESRLGTEITYDKRATAEAIIGQPVMNEKKQKIATVEDIILDENGIARLVVVKDSGLLGFGSKLAAFEYSTVVKNDGKAEMVTPLTEKDIDSAATFTYDADNADKKTRLIPNGGISVAHLLDGNLHDSAGKKVAAIEDVTFKAGKADMILTDPGMGSRTVALGFKTASFTKENDTVNLNLDAQSSTRFEQLKQSKSTK
jgi:sporulation protein YlmC with PRC-barrel domain